MSTFAPTIAANHPIDNSGPNQTTIIVIVVIAGVVAFFIGYQIYRGSNFVDGPEAERLHYERIRRLPRAWINRGGPRSKNELAKNWVVITSLRSSAIDRENNCSICFNAFFPRQDSEVRIRFTGENPVASDKRLSTPRQEVSIHTPTHNNNPDSAIIPTSHSITPTSGETSSGHIYVHIDPPPVTPPALVTISRLSNITPTSPEGGVVVELQCKHVFHEVCIMQWAILHDNCPLCRFAPRSTNTPDDIGRGTTYPLT